MIERRMERLRPEQFRALREDTPLAFLPLGILEWHGPHNPLGLDGVKAHALCLRVAEQTGGVVFPTLYYGTPPAAHHLTVDHFDPAITAAYGLPAENFTTDRMGFGSRLQQWHLFDQVLDQTLRQIVRYGFEAILILSGHYPLRNQQEVAIGIERDFGVPVWFGHEGEASDPPDGDHAGQWETSLTLALAPDTVDPGAFPASDEPNPPGVFGKPVADVTPELAAKNVERAVAGLTAKARMLLERRSALQPSAQNRNPASAGRPIPAAKPTPQQPPMPGEQYPSFTDDGAWCWFQDPRAVYVAGSHKRTYAGWMTHAGQLRLGTYDHETGAIQQVTLKEQWDPDDHNTCAFLVLPDRRLMVFYARHNVGPLFCTTSRRPEDITDWEPEVQITDDPRTTYSHPVQLAGEGGRIYVFWRGSTWKPTFATSMDGKTWAGPHILIQEKGREDPRIRPYIKVVSDGQSTIHFAFTDGHPRNEPTNSLYYLKYEGGAFYRADGTLVGDMESLPIAHSQSDRVYDGRATGVRAWVWDIALDAAGHPVIGYTRLPEETDHRYHYARWTGETWMDVELTPAGRWFPQTPAGSVEREPHYSGGLCLHHANPDIVYLSRQIQGIHEIERWTTSDGGKSWEATPITAHSQYPNVRPVVPRGYAGPQDHVLWMNGEYVHYYEAYRTAIRIRRG